MKILMKHIKSICSLVSKLFLSLCFPLEFNVKNAQPFLSLPDGSPMPVAHELWISQDKKLQVTALIAIWDAADLDFDTLMDLPPSSLCFILVLHWLRRKATMEDWEVFSFLATHVRMRHFSVDQLWRMDDMSISKSLTARLV